MNMHAVGLALKVIAVYGICNADFGLSSTTDAGRLTRQRWIKVLRNLGVDSRWHCS